MAEKRKSTKTSSFGTSGRINHDSSEFYDSKLYKEMLPGKSGKKSYIENQIPDEYKNRIFCSSSEKMEDLPDSSIHLMVTSPPYNVSKEYDEDLSLNEYRSFLKRVFKEIYRVLVTGGRACINIANVGRKPYIPLHAFIIEDMSDAGFLMRGEIIWNKGATAGASTAWGSWMSASNPCLRDVHEYILVFCKEDYKRANPHNRKKTILKEDFLQWTKSVWDFPSASAKKTGHPAPFPIELPRRLIELYTFEDETILDPFCGSGTTCIAAKLLKRNYVGYDINQEYAALAEKRIGSSRSNEQKTLP